MMGKGNGRDLPPQQVQIQLAQVGKYRAVLTPTRDQLERDPAAADLFAAELSRLSAAGQNHALLIFDGFVLVVEVVDYRPLPVPGVLSTPGMRMEPGK